MKKPGLVPYEFNVVVRPDKVETQTKGGLYLSDDDVDKQQFAMNRGEIVALSDMAFQDIWDENRPRPTAGKRVLFVKHAGVVYEDPEGTMFRVMKDKDIVAEIEED